MARRVLCLLLLEFEANGQRISPDVTAENLHERNTLLFSKTEIGRTVKFMAEAGSRYRNIDKSLKIQGVVFLLGTGLGES